MSKRGPRQRLALDTDVEMNMTPMIDIVFQMILFFIIITDFTQKDIALLTLPWSTVGQEDDGEDSGRIIINITAPVPTDPSNVDPRILRDSDKILIKEKPYDFEQLAQYLELRGVKDPRFREKDNPGLSTRSILIRCDGQQAFDYVKAILQICAQPTVAIYRIEIATSEKPE